MQVVVHCLGLSKSEIQFLEDLKRRTKARIKIVSYGEQTTLTATGTYNDIVEIVKEVTILRNFEIHLT